MQEEYLIDCISLLEKLKYYIISNKLSFISTGYSYSVDVFEFNSVFDMSAIFNEGPISLQNFQLIKEYITTSDNDYSEYLSDNTKLIIELRDNLNNCKLLYIRINDLGQVWVPDENYNIFSNVINSILFYLIKLENNTDQLINEFPNTISSDESRNFSSIFDIFYKYIKYNVFTDNTSMDIKIPNILNCYFHSLTPIDCGQIKDLVNNTERKLLCLNYVYIYNSDFDKYIYFSIIIDRYGKWTLDIRNRYDLITDFAEHEKNIVNLIPQILNVILLSII